jgi:GntR family transcriptional repressor for pyruvate dehydrogenase complex
MMKDDVSGDKLGEFLDAQFHCTIAESTQNKVLVNLMSTIYDLLLASIKLSRQKLFFTPGNLEIILKQHKDIWEAIAAREPALARNKMNEHLDFVSMEIFVIKVQPDHPESASPDEI